MHHMTSYDQVEKEPVMSPLRPLDPAFPIQRQIAIEASPAGERVHPRQSGRADPPQDPGGRRGLHDAPAGLHLHPTSPRDRRKPDLFKLCGLESTADFRAEFSQPKFRAKLSAYPSAAMPWGGEAS